MRYAFLETACLGFKRPPPDGFPNTGGLLCIGERSRAHGSVTCTDTSDTGPTGWQHSTRITRTSYHHPHIITSPARLQLRPEQLQPRLVMEHPVSHPSRSGAVRSPGALGAHPSAPAWERASASLQGFTWILNFMPITLITIFTV